MLTEVLLNINLCDLADDTSALSEDDLAQIGDKPLPTLMIGQIPDANIWVTTSRLRRKYVYAWNERDFYKEN